MAEPIEITVKLVWAQETEPYVLDGVQIHPSQERAFLKGDMCDVTWSSPGGNTSWTSDNCSVLCLVEFTRMRHRDRSLLSTIVLF